MLFNRLICFSSILFLALGCSNSNKPTELETTKPNKEQHIHHHTHTPHHGIEAKLYSKKQFAGIIELKLHDDKGDLELWLTNHDSAHSPLDLALDTKITVTFIYLNKKEVQLQVRNTKNNEDEDGIGNIRKGKTNYFIFPGDRKEDSSFLIGKDFSAQVQLNFTHEGQVYQSNTFELKPHVH
ncbi:hypothetical protein PQO01_12190 [Lentisphaera marina]|uniref:hypothetical protein n=1 Tax=Lentisphaera marina TaxID=1111041 RepID=UPI00236571DB|nr:hypothetical protein [Lentisphaera marina]MDD7985711.1 hypothetical protein [Lentisphaera marina]